MMTEMTETEDSESRAPVANKTTKEELPVDQFSDSHYSGYVPITKTPRLDI